MRRAFGGAAWRCVAALAGGSAWRGGGERHRRAK